MGAFETLVGIGAGRGGSSSVPRFSRVLRLGDSAFGCCIARLPIGGRIRSLPAINMKSMELCVSLTTLIEQLLTADYS